MAPSRGGNQSFAQNGAAESLLIARNAKQRVKVSCDTLHGSGIPVLFCAESFLEQPPARRILHRAAVRIVGIFRYDQPSLIARKTLLSCLLGIKRGLCNSRDEARRARRAVRRDYHADDGSPESTWQLNGAGSYGIHLRDRC